MTRLFVHVDMDAFYASVEVRDQPDLADKPVAVIVPGRRGVVMTANYVARGFGVKSALPVHLARQRCPSIILIPQRMDVYRAVSAQIHGIFARSTEVIEPLALDEAYLTSRLPSRGQVEGSRRRHIPGHAPRRGTWRDEAPLLGRGHVPAVLALFTFRSAK